MSTRYYMINPLALEPSLENIHSIGLEVWKF